MRCFFFFESMTKSFFSLLVKIELPIIKEMDWGHLFNTKEGISQRNSILSTLLKGLNDAFFFSFKKK